MRRSAILAAALTAPIALFASVAPATADDTGACVSYADNIARARASDANASNWYFAGEYARALVARFDTIVGGAPDGIGAIAAVSAHVHSANGAQAVDLRFYGQNGCDLGPGATLAIFLYSAIVQQIGAGA